MSHINLESLNALITLLTPNNITSKKSLNDERKSNCLGQYCIIRTYSMGVYFAKIKEILGQGFQGSIIAIEEARIIHSWSGAKTTLDIANNGITSGNLSGIASYLEIDGVGVMIPCSDKVKKQFLNFCNIEYKF